MKDIREYRSVESIYKELEAINEQMLKDIKQIFKERNITTLRIFVDDDGRNLSDEDFDFDQAYERSPLLYLNYFNKDGCPFSGYIYEISVTDDEGVSIHLYNETRDRHEVDFLFESKDILDIYDAVVSAIMRNEVEQKP